MSLFIAWMPDGPTLQRLAALREACRQSDGAGWTSWRKDAQLHVTLRFLAHLPPEQPTTLGDSIASVADRHCAFALSFDQVQPWASALVLRPAANEPLRHLLAELNDAAVSAGYMQMDTQTPHLTLAYPPRDGGGRKQRITQVPRFDPALLPIDASFQEIALVQTEPGGYRKIRGWPLSGDRS